MTENYTYILASMPVMNPDSRPEASSCLELLKWIKDQLGKKDAELVGLIEEGFSGDGSLPMEDFYRKAVVHPNAFIRTFFTADMHLKNAKVDYLNRKLDRPKGQDILTVEGAAEDTDGARTQAIFGEGDLLSREKAIDGYLWEKADEITLYKYFELDNILATAVKLCIIRRWVTLDYETGRKLLRQLVKEVRGTYGKIEFHTFR